MNVHNAKACEYEREPEHDIIIWSELFLSDGFEWKTFLPFDFPLQRYHWESKLIFFVKVAIKISKFRGNQIAIKLQSAVINGTIDDKTMN